MSATWNDALSSEVQALALTGYDLDCALHLLLTIDDGIKARALIDFLLRDGRLRFGEDTGGVTRTSQAVNIGFTYRGLCRLGLPQRHLDALQLHARAFCEGATSRAARRLGDSGASAAECWDDTFAADRADVLISIHGVDPSAVRRTATELSDLPGAKQAFSGWGTGRIEAAHLDGGADAFGKIRDVHFGFRDNLARPGILARQAARGVKPPEAGELLLGHANDKLFNRWAASDTVPPDVAAFFRNSSFAILRRIEQDEGEFNRWLKEQSARLIAKFPHATGTYLKAKLCGRWPNGALLRPGQTTEPALTQADLQPFDFLDDTLGKGCPFGAHIRRTNPRRDNIFPPRLRPLFRRGMPYGPRYAANPSAKRGLVGLFFCASIEDQFEHLLSEWVEKRPMGPPNRGTAKDPLIGNHDEPAAEFHIPQPIGDDLVLGGASGGEPFAHFVTTRGTLYALFPGRYALAEIGRLTNAPPAGAPVHSLSPMGQDLATGSQRSATTAKGDDKGDETLGRARAPADRFCDLVMEGGVTSGIIYAAAVVELSKAYRFRSIGGSSIGAFAAAAAAAAEYRRRNGSMEGFRGLAQLPTKLAEEDRGKPLLQRLFRSQDSTRRLFAIFLSTLGYKSKWARFSHGLFTAIRQYWREEALAGVLLALIVLAGPLAFILRRALASPPEMVASEWIELLAWLPAAVATMPLALLAGIGIGVIGDVRRGLVPNGFGLCRGWTVDDDKEKSKKEKDKEEKEEEERSANEADSKDSGRDSKIEQRREPAPDLTGYLHATIQTLAGRNALDAPPLTFKDLWTAPGSPMEALGYPASVRDRSINLEVYATNLAHGRPYRFPGDDADDMGRLFFHPEELEKYFPKPVLQHLMAFSVPYEPNPKTRSDPPAEAGGGLRELPGEHLPIVVATRFALSFPLLISAVPLWAIDYEPRREERKLERCWFSDGGLCSNFPIHLFDSFIPKWPTFGISLHKRGKYREEQKVWLPEKHFEGRGDTWDRGLDDDRPALQRLGRFVLSLWLATWRWNDMTTMRMPGVRDRVVRVMLKEEEGGVNIKMSGKQILALANDYGKPAAKAFIRKFAAEGSTGWAEHRWVRLNRLLIALREQIDGISFSAGLGRHATTLQQQLSSASGTPPLRGPSRGDPGASEKALRPEQLRELESLLGLLSDVEQVVSGAGDHQPFNAVPRPSLRIRHPT